MTNRLRITLALTASSVLAAAVPTAAADPRAKIVTTGTFTAPVASCPAPDEACGGKLEFDGQHFGFTGGALKGRVNSAGIVSRGRLSFGRAITDPAVDGPVQMSFQTIATAAPKGGFGVTDSPHGAADEFGLAFVVRVPLIVRVRGAIPADAASNGAGASTGPHCTIGSRAFPVMAQFVPTLSGFFTGSWNSTYSQATGTTDLTARMRWPGAERCAGLEDTVDQQLGIPGPGSVKLNLAFRRAIQSNVYRLHHRQGS